MVYCNKRVRVVSLMLKLNRSVAHNRGILDLFIGMSLVYVHMFNAIMAVI